MKLHGMAEALRRWPEKPKPHVIDTPVWRVLDEIEQDTARRPRRPVISSEV